MAYHMRFRVKMFLLNPQDTAGSNKEPVAGEVPIFDVGSYEVSQLSPGIGGGEIGITSVVISSLARGVAAVASINNRIQSSLLTNVRFEVYGKPVGSPEAGAVDIPANLQAEKRYILGDTPQPALLVALHRANRKPVDPLKVKTGVYIPTDDTPEVDDSSIPARP